MKKDLLSFILVALTVFSLSIIINVIFSVLKYNNESTETFEYENKETAIEEAQTNVEDDELNHFANDYVGTLNIDRAESSFDYFLNGLDYKGCLYDFNGDTIPELVYTNLDIKNNILFASNKNNNGYERVKLPYNNPSRISSANTDGEFLVSGTYSSNNSNVAYNCIVDSRDNFKIKETLSCQTLEDKKEYFLNDELTDEETYENKLKSYDNFKGNITDNETATSIKQMFKKYSIYDDYVENDEDNIDIE